MKKGSNIRLRSDGRYEARYEKGRSAEGRIIYGYAYGKTYEEAEEKRNWQINLNRKTAPILMNLLILGAGAHGKETFEIAENMRCFNKISFLDDNESIPGVIGPCTNLVRYFEEYHIAIPAIGNSEIRRRWINLLIKDGFIIPNIIEPSAVISKNSTLGYGNVICAGAVINTGACIGNGCIISSGSIIGRNAIMEDFSFLQSGETQLY